MPIPFTIDELRTATHELIAANELRECYIRPIVVPRLRADGPVPARRAGRRDDRRLEVGRYLGEDGKRHGIRAKVSSWRRIPHDSLIPHGEGQRPVPQQRAGQDRGVEGRLSGGDPARLTHGFVCEGSGENIFIVRDGRILTPPQTASILDGISRSR